MTYCFRIYIVAILLFVYAVTAYAQKPHLVMAQVPEFMGLCREANLYIIRQEVTITAHDLDSGQKRWTYNRRPTDVNRSSVRGKTNLILGDGSDGQFRTVVLKKETGEILWDRTERTSSENRALRNLRDSDWFLAYYYDPHGRSADFYYLLFSPDGEKSYRLPKDMYPQGWWEEGKTLVLLARDTEGARMVFWDLGNNTTRDIGTLRGYLYEGRLNHGGILESRQHKDPETPVGLRVLDGDTGRHLRDVSLPGPIDGISLNSGGKAFLVTGDNGNRLWMLDADNDTVLATLHHPGHAFHLDSLSTDASGRNWIVSSDAENSRYLWPVEPDAVPRKFFDGRPFFTGSIAELFPPYIITLNTPAASMGTPKSIYRAIHFEEVRVVAVWIPGQSGQVYELKPCRAM